MEMGAGDCSGFMHFFTPIFRDETIGVKATLRRKAQTRNHVDWRVGLAGRAAWIDLGLGGCSDQASRCRCQRRKGIDSTTVVSRYTRIPNFTAGTSGA